jgi:precorrin-3B C17-methyltransferase
MPVAVGLGCDRGTPLATVRRALAQALGLAGIAERSVRVLASINIKADEAAFIALAVEGAWPLRFFGAAELAAVPVPNPSETVRKYTGTPSVSEAAALLAAGTGAVNLLLEKHKLKGADGKSATISIARIPMTHTTPAPGTPERRGGKIMLVGIGPGSHDHMTHRARAAIAEADVVVGYVTYIKLVADLLEGKEVIRKGMTEELDRAVHALQSAREGKKVALISSGDAGVYGMAGPTYEVLFQAGWTPESDVVVEVVPGASAINACAALVGAPLTHDFCSISLSDLLTPWPVIARRLDAVAAADFVVALYNPKSGRRTQQIVEAQRLFLRHRRPDTPVAVVKSAYRRRERIEFTTLDHMSECDIGMLTTVLIGNSNTFVRHGLMVTPRGYANKYDLNGDGNAREGERRGRSLSSGLLGWVENLRIDHAEGESIAALALRHQLPADYIEAVLAAPMEDAVTSLEEPEA